MLKAQEERDSLGAVQLPIVQKSGGMHIFGRYFGDWKLRFEMYGALISGIPSDFLLL